MRTIEDLLRDAFEADAQTVRAQDMPPLTRPDHISARRSWRRPARGRLVIPATAAAAVLAIALVGGVAIPRLLTGTVTAGQPISSLIRAELFAPDSNAGRPTFLVGGYDGKDHTANLGIYSARSGRMISSIGPPRPGVNLITAAATGNPLSFVVAAEPRSGSCTTQFYRLTLSRRGHVASLEPLRVPEVHGEIIPPSGLAASASGQTIAYTANGCGGRTGWLGVVDVPASTNKIWRADSESLWSLSLSADGAQVLYVNSTVYGGNGSIQILRTTAKPGPLAQRARTVAAGNSGIGSDGSVALAADGKTVLVCTESAITSLRTHPATVSALTAASGRPLGIVYRWSDATIAPCMISVAPSSPYLLVSDISARALGTWVNLITGKTSPIPGGVQNPPSGLAG